VIKSSRVKWSEHMARLSEERRVYRFLVRKPEGKRPLGRTRRRWVIILECISRGWDVGKNLHWTGPI
jgi:hypothetical protein